MNRITKHNYESYYLDYLEGNLKAEDVAALLLFLEQHPDLKCEFDTFEDARLELDNVTFAKKPFLKTMADADYLMIGAIENSNSELENKQLEKLLSGNKSFTTSFDLYKQTILNKSNVTYPNKKQLKRSASYIVYLYPFSAVAALLILFFLVYDNINKQDKVIESSISETILKEELLLDTSDLNSKNIILMANEENSYKEKGKTTIPTIGFGATSPKDTLPSIQVDSPPKNNAMTATVKNDTSTILFNNSDELTAVPFDSIAEPIEVALNSNTIKTNDPLTLKQLLNNKIRKVVLKEENPSFDNITGKEIMANVTEGIASKTEKEVAFAQESSKDKEITQFSIGKFEFYRTKSK
jgi:hypothetical protein